MTRLAKTSPPNHFASAVNYMIITFDRWHAIEARKHATANKLSVNNVNSNMYCHVMTPREHEVKSNMKEAKLKRTKFGVWPAKIECC